MRALELTSRLTTLAACISADRRWYHLSKNACNAGMLAGSACPESVNAGNVPSAESDEMTDALGGGGTDVG